MRKAGVTSCVDGERVSFFLIKILTQGLVSRVVLAPGVVAESYDPVLNELSDHGRLDYLGKMKLLVGSIGLSWKDEAFGWLNGLVV